MNNIITVIFIIASVAGFSCKTEKKQDKNYNNGGFFLDGIKGNDRNNGNVKNPVKTITRLNELLESKLDNVYISGGQIYDGTLIIRNRSAGEEDPVSVSSVGEERAVINGGDGEAIRIENCRNIRVSNIDIKGNGRKTGNISNGFSLVNSVNCIIEYIIAEDFRKSGVELYDCRNVEVKKVLAIDNGFCGINVMGSSLMRSGNILIRDCMAENNAGDPTILDNHSGNGILVGVSDSVTIDHCTATNNGWDMPRLGNGPVGIWAWQSDHIIIQYCISYRNKTSPGAKDGGGFDLDGGVTNSIIQYCLSYENQGAGYGLFQYPGASDWSNNIIRYCISFNDALTTEGAGSIFIWNGSDEAKQLSSCYIHNNVAFNSSAPVISFENASAHKNFIFCNNIFLCDSSFFSGSNSGSTFLGNVWWNPKGTTDMMGHKSLAAWAESTHQEMQKGKLRGIQADPRFYGPLNVNITDPYKLNTLRRYGLRPDSPLKDKGIDIQSIFGKEHPRTDFFGNPVPQGRAAEPGIYEMN
ncbi:MAG TPA: right-handed parallel beta-helix repeat-containing protein [Bacteroidales bacterium]|nr:right-handed parallel beta-helix repeat-containing protein [Bacteroidales bacterium]